MSTGGENKPLPQMRRGLLKTRKRLSGDGRSRGLAFEIAFLIWTCDHGAILQELFHQVFVPATRAFLGNRLVGRSEFAFRVVRAPIKRVALARALFNKFAVFAEWALHADEVLFYVFAFRITAAGGEFAVAAVADHEIPSAIRARLIERDIGHTLPLIEPARG